METSTSDIIFGAIILAIVLVLAIAAGRLLNKLKNNRFAKAWEPLVSILNGTIVSDNGGAASSYLAGIYKGSKVQACMVPNRNRYSGQTGQRFNYFEIALPEVSGLTDWKISYKWPLLGIGKQGWHIESEDTLLEERLNKAGIIEMVTPFGSPTIAFRAKQQTLLLTDDAGSAWVPEPGRFSRQLDLLVQLSKLNTEVNPPHQLV